MYSFWVIRVSGSLGLRVFVLEVFVLETTEFQGYNIFRGYTFHKVDLMKRSMFSTLTSRFIPFSLNTKTSSILEPTCWPSSDNLIKLTIKLFYRMR